MLKLNDDKTEFILFKSKNNVNTFGEQNIQVSGTEVYCTAGKKILK